MAIVNNSTVDEAPSCFCENCDKPLSEDDAVYEMNGKIWCEQCYTGYGDYLEYIYSAQRSSYDEEKSEEAS